MRTGSAPRLIANFECGLIARNFANECRLPRQHGPRMWDGLRKTSRAEHAKKPVPVETSSTSQPNDKPASARNQIREMPW